MLVKDFMSRSVVTCRADDTLDTAAQLMREHDLGALPVCNDRGHLVGMVTDRDLCLAAQAQSGTFADLMVHSAMSHQPKAIHGDARLFQAEDLMATHRLRRIPVVDDERRPIGMITLTDLVREAIGPGGDVSRGTVLRILSAIVQPHARGEAA